MKKVSVVFLCMLVLAVFSLWASDAGAYERYNDGCQNCHGAFTDTTSTKPGNVWPDSKHIVHRDQMLAGECDACHSSGDQKNPYLNMSNGTPELPGIGCLGCHGPQWNFVDPLLSQPMGTGLRYHHMKKGVDECMLCHNDVDPFLDNPELKEYLMPEYYGKSGVFITDPCNSDGFENWTSDGLGLDNDGDALYDSADPDCGISCFINEDCTPAEFCKKAEGDCAGSGTCQPMANPCFPILDPVCGCDGITYRSECDADLAGVSVDFLGECPPGCTDADGDGFAIEGGNCGPVDCDDNDFFVNPGVEEICEDGVDNNCSGAIDGRDPVDKCCDDADFDGYPAQDWCGLPVDCDDNDFFVNPGVEEICEDGVDNNCDGLIDDSDPVCTPPLCTDVDGDGYAIEGGGCGPIDCNDSDPAINPGAIEVCDGIDNNCDGVVDEGFDADSDGYTTCGGDCNDNDPTSYPGAIEICTDGNDNDCNTLIDCADPACDLDLACCVPTADREKGKQCRDGIDNDCDGAADSADPDCNGGDGGGGDKEICDDGIDNDGDGKTDCDDKKDCGKDSAC